MNVNDQDWGWFGKYLVRDLQVPRKAIYDASPIEKLKDLKKTCEMAISYLEVVEPLRKASPDDLRELKQDEFAIGDWIVRPRF